MHVAHIVRSGAIVHLPEQASKAAEGLPPGLSHRRLKASGGAPSLPGLTTRPIRSPPPLPAAWSMHSATFSRSSAPRAVSKASVAHR
jgi:hypothetical protein